jgi:hypothetical protein
MPCNWYILGEKLTKEEAKGLMKELCDPADDDGFMPFKRKFIFNSSFYHINSENKIDYLKYNTVK